MPNHAVIKWYSVEKAFGFGSPDDGSDDLFIHRTIVAKAGLTELKAGDRIEFDSKVTTKGRLATRIRLIP
jgi:cold shock CspA family protein